MKGQWVFGGIERNSGKVFICAVEDRSSQTLLPLIEKHIAPGSVIYTDCWRAYNDIKKKIIYIKQ